MKAPDSGMRVARVVACLSLNVRVKEDTRGYERIREDTSSVKFSRAERIVGADVNF
jgi:hypothetical protein